MHENLHPRSGAKVTLVDSFDSPGFIFEERPVQFVVEDWWDHLTGRSWEDMAATGNPACRNYGMRQGLPSDGEVVYGKIGHLGYLVHQSEIVAGDCVCEHGEDLHIPNCQYNYEEAGTWYGCGCMVFEEDLEVSYE